MARAGEHLIALIIGPGQDRQIKQPVVYLADIRAEILEAAVIQAASFKNDFESVTQLPAGWTSQGKIVIDKQNAFKGKQSLVLEQPPENAEKPCSVTTASFAVTPGLWEIALACKSDLKSPDNSFNGVVTLECLNGSGKTVNAVVLADLFGRKNWQPISKRVEVAKGVSSARFHVQLNKASGRFWIDELSAAYVSAAPKKDTPRRSHPLCHGPDGQPALSRGQADGEDHGGGDQGPRREAEGGVLRGPRLLGRGTGPAGQAGAGSPTARGQELRLRCRNRFGRRRSSSPLPPQRGTG